MKNLILYCFILSLAILIFACQEEKTNVNQPLEDVTARSVASCEGCHTNYDHLKAVYTPDPPSGGGAGCGGDTPHIEPYDRVYLGGDGYQDFKNEIHGTLNCTDCHNGVDNTSDKAEAHSGSFISKPSHYADQKCSSCHADIVERNKLNIHQGWGQKSMVALRAGKGNVPEGFDQLSDMMKDGYDHNCAKCHASCGDCHVNRPKAGGGGLYKGHSFIKTPDMQDHCTTCHVSRGGHAYYGVAPGTVPDVHLSSARFKCMDCHTKNEIHGDGNLYDQRYKYPELPKCENCHSGLENSNLFHTMHLNTFNCQACHSQDYNNCGSCHIGGEGARIASYQGFKIGMNPIPETKTKYKFALLRQSLSAPDSWKNYGIDNLSNFAVRPTYKYTTPHNIIRITPRTGFKDTNGDWQVNSNCTSGCHISKNSDGTFKNKELYLFEEDLQDWEKPADQGIIVNGKLPNGWE